MRRRAGGQIDFLGGGYDQNRNLHLRVWGGVLAGAFCGVFGGVSDDYGRILLVRTVKVDGKDIKEDTWYTLQDGQFVEAKL